MRLTLRTLLAYMDDILDPTDHEELGRKIEASDFATELIHRSRDASRRLRLGAPPVLADDDDIHGGGRELDPNTMAEYLDNVLPPDDVAEFERACLAPGNQGDMLLAEAVSCHHVLTMVLGEPAEVDVDLRRRVYELGAAPNRPAQSLRIEPARVPRTTMPEAPAATPAPTPAAAAASLAPDHVPEYLRVAAEMRRRKRRLATMTAAAVVAGAVVWWAWPTEVELPSEMAGLDTEEFLAGVDVGPGDSSPAPVAPSGTPPAWSPENATPAADDVEPAAEPEQAPMTADSVDPTTRAPEAEDDAPLRAPGAPEDSAEGPSLAPAPNGVPSMPDIPLGPTEEVADELADAPADAEPTMPATDPATASASSTSPPRLGSDLPPVPPTETDEEPLTGLEPMTEDRPAPSADEATRVAGPRPTGTYLGMMGAYDMLLGYDADGRKWRRLAPRTPYGDGSRLLTLPTFRTMTSLRDANVYLGGGAELELIPAGALPGSSRGDFAVSVPRGRLIINSGINGNRFDLVVDDQPRRVELNPSSTLAIEVRGVFVPGRDPADGLPPRTIRWLLTTGGGTIADDQGEQKLVAPVEWISAPGDFSAPRPIGELPEWVDHEPLTDVQRRAQKSVVQALAPGAPVEIKLLELTDPAGAGRLREDRTLAAECAAHVGLYEPLIKALGDADQKAYWRRLLDVMRQMLATDSQAAEALRADLVGLRGERDAALLFEMILGYDPAVVAATREDFESGVLARLIRRLDGKDLDVRVLALANLNELTGTNGLGGYQPWQTASQRARALRIYDDRLRKGELAPVE
ncbi:MAG: hypothetical protein KF688_08895 [Pirellulales bacterium]|nr:hypothetical protein [Pirellulales bacterium]